MKLSVDSDKLSNQLLRHWRGIFLKKLFIFLWAPKQGHISEFEKFQHDIKLKSLDEVFFKLF